MKCIGIKYQCPNLNKNIIKTEYRTKITTITEYGTTHTAVVAIIKCECDETHEVLIWETT